MLTLCWLGKVAVKLYQLERPGSRYHTVLRTMERCSPQWPPSYPPPVLSKLVPGHEAFAPPEVVVSEDDGYRLINGNQTRLEAAFEELGGSVVLKKVIS
jgi:hypothetical protein